MLSGVSVICFVASYTIAFLLEATRPLFRSGIRGAAMLGWAGAGFLAHTLFLYYNAISPDGYPITSQQGWFYLAAWILVGAYLYLTLHHVKTAFGLYLLPVVLALIGIGYFWADPNPFAEGVGRSVWAVVHGVTLLLMLAASSIGFVGGVMYLLQARRLKRKVAPGRGLQLPTLEWLQRLSTRALTLVTILLGLGVLSGLVLNRVEFAAAPADAVPWYDPVVVGSGILFVWLLVWQVLRLIFRPLGEGHRVAYQTLVCFLLLLLILAGGVVFETRHWRGQTPQDIPAPQGVDHGKEVRR